MHARIQTTSKQNNAHLLDVGAPQGNAGPSAAPTMSQPEGPGAQPHMALTPETASAALAAPAPQRLPNSWGRVSSQSIGSAGG